MKLQIWITERRQQDKIRIMSREIFILLLFPCLLSKMDAFMTLDEIARSEYKITKKLGNNKMSKVKDYEEYATAYMNLHDRDYFNNGAGDMQTIQDNELAYKRIRIRPKLLRNVSHRNMNLTVFGQPLRVPFGASPVAVQRMAHPDGEVGTARAVASLGGITILSMLATTSVEELQRKTPPGSVHWAQVYIAKDRGITKRLVHRAGTAGFKAIVVTADSPVSGMWGQNLVHNFTVPDHLSLPNLSSEGEGNIGGSTVKSSADDILLDPSLTWNDIQWLRTITALPIVVKGILTAEDAVLAVEHGASGILVSNHGGRQLDGVPATLDVLPEIARAVGGKAEVFVDGGVRSGTDVFKALALGAKAVFIGRPCIWGLVHSGEAGVTNVMNIVRRGLDKTMALAGASQLKDIVKSHVVRAESYLYNDLRE